MHFLRCDVVACFGLLDNGFDFLINIRITAVSYFLSLNGRSSYSMLSTPCFRFPHQLQCNSSPAALRLFLLLHCVRVLLHFESTR